MTLCLTNLDHVTMYVCGPTAYNPDPRQLAAPGVEVQDRADGPAWQG